MSRIRKSARNEQCQIRIPGVCNFDPETTVLAHRNGGGIGAKTPDFQASYACSACHSYIDSHYDDTTLRYFYEGVFRTQRILVEKRLLEI